MSSYHKYYYTPGKLLLTGEYLILEGAKGLAIPLKFGQNFTIISTTGNKPKLIWEAVYPDGIWFEGEFSIPQLKIITTTDINIANRLIEIIIAIRKMNPEFLISGELRVKTVLDFNPEFGFGSSSTLIVNLARFANVDAFELQQRTFNGSGYDVAVGLSAKPIIYHLNNGKPNYTEVNFNPSFAENIFFVYLGKKQRSLEAINKFRNTSSFSQTDIDAISNITKNIIQTQSLDKFEFLLKKHEQIMSKILKTPTIQKQLFSDYTDGIVKSLGAWGGDFVLITSKENPNDFKENMHQRGFEVVYRFREILNL